MKKHTRKHADADKARGARRREAQGKPVQLDAESPPREKPADLNRPLNDVIRQKQRRKHQLKAIKQFFDDPSQFGIDADDVPHSSSREEILERHKELTYRSRLLRSVLVVLRREAEKLQK